MTCDRRLVSSYRDGELTPESRSEVGEHLQECAECAAALRGYRRLAQTIRSMPVQPVPPSLAVGLRRELAEREARRTRIGPFGALVRAAAPAFAAAGVAVAVLVLLRPGAGEAPRSISTAAQPAQDSGSRERSAVAQQPVASRAVAVAPPAYDRVSGDDLVGFSGALAEERLRKAPASISRLYESNQMFPRQLGMPAEGSKAVTLLEQSFQGGLAIRRGDTREIYVLNRADKTWSAYQDNAKSGAPVVIEGAPPPGAVAPEGGFGHLWLSYPELRERLGWAVYATRGSGGAIQVFERGLILWSPHGLLYVLADDGTWKTYPDAAPL
ncbi:MAG: zf-HC2 domain-containing protein [Chloroflexi bacterium]|nr:zf-HC2 domain-containing protein [Chloroflexota bacterium]